LLATALDLEVGLRERTELFLEIYGNAFISTKGLEYVKEKAAQVARVLSGGSEEGDRLVSEALDWSQLKHKELDQVLEVILQWRNGTVLDMEKYWDDRLRQYYGQRYDFRKNAADWDYHMKLKKFGFDIINSREYIKWRSFGIAFEFRDTSYTVPNITMGSYAAGRRSTTKTSIMARGFWSDIINSPYIAFGLEADFEKLFKVRNKENVHTSCDVSQYNVTQMLHALWTGERIQPRVIQSGMGSMGDDAPSEDDLNAVNTVKIDPRAVKNPVRMVMLLGESQKTLDRKKFEALFDGVIISSLAASNASSEWMNRMLSRKDTNVPVVVMETAKFALDFKPDQKTEFVRRCYLAGKEAGWLAEGAVPVVGEAEAQLRFVACGEDGQEHWKALPDMPVPEGMEDDKAAKEVEGLMGMTAATPEEEEGQEQKALPEPEGGVIKGKASAAKDEVSALTKTEIVIVQRNPDRVTRRPRELLVKCRLPGLDSAEGVEVDVAGEARTVRVDHAGRNLHAEAKLPFPVDEEKGSATFNVDTSTLLLTLPVIAAVVDEKDALQHLEEGGTEEQPNAEGVEDHPMVQAQKIGMIAAPRKMGNNIMF